MSLSDKGKAATIVKEKVAEASPGFLPPDGKDLLSAATVNSSARTSMGRR